MKTIIFFLALLFSMITVLNVIASVSSSIVKAMLTKTTNTSLVPEAIWGLISIALWTYFYYL